MRIGSIKTDGNAVLGPMSGFTSSGYREFMKPFGVSLSMTEMVSDNGILYGHEKTVSYVDFEKCFPTGLQLFGSDPDRIAKAAEIALKRNPNIDFIDVNMGCPVYKIIKNGAGSALMKDPFKCKTIMERLKATVDVPVTAKIRLGWDENHMNFMEVIWALIQGGADAVTLHVRTMEDRYSGQPKYDLVHDLGDMIPIPLIISGDIYSVDDAIFAQDLTAASGIMVARGGIGNPFLITQIRNYFDKGKRLENPSVHQQIEWCLALTEKLVAEKGEVNAVRKMRSIAPKFVAGYRRSREYRKKLATQSYDLEALKNILSEIDEKMGDETFCYSKTRDDDFYQS